jgi:glycosyltransferase involved in cell wall biosynthesis
MPAYNHARFVRQAVESVWAQTLSPLELIVIDDGSRDETGAMAEAMAARSPVPMKVVRRENRGVSRTLNDALAMSSGEWIAFLASDDYYLPDFLRSCLEAARAANDPAVVVHANAHFITEDGVRVGVASELCPLAPLIGRDGLRKIAYGSERVIVPATLFLRSELLRQVGAFDETMAAEDYDLHLRLSRQASFEFVRRPVYCARVVRGSLGRRPWVWGQDTIRAWEKHRDALPEELPQILFRRRADLAAACFSQGGVGHGVRWAGEALRMQRGLQRLRSATVLAARAVVGLVRYASVRVLPDSAVERIRRWKHGISSRRRAVSQAQTP